MSDVSPTPPRVLLIGRRDEPCFAEAMDWLCGAARVEAYATAAEALSALRTVRHAANTDDDAGPLRGIVFLAARPGEIERPQVEAVHAAEPLARLVILAGTWCEGEGRSGRIVPGAARIYWHQWRGELPAALGLDREAQSSFSPLRTLTDGERLERALVTRNSLATDGPLVAVCCWTRTNFDALADALVAGGFRAQWQHPSRPVSEGPSGEAWLWDGWEAYEASLPAPAEARRVLLLDFPRLDDVERARVSGIDQVIAKPFTLPQLWRAAEAGASQARSASEGS